MSESRRGFLAKVSGVLMATAGARTAVSLIAPSEAEAYHFCGHIYTTDSCPHPTGLPRIDSKGRPLRTTTRAKACPADTRASPRAGRCERRTATASTTSAA